MGIWLKILLRRTINKEEINILFLRNKTMKFLRNNLVINIQIIKVNMPRNYLFLKRITNSKISTFQVGKNSIPKSKPTPWVLPIEREIQIRW